jgi:3-deoxy-manno-octulosonate cytidylyltransferase (CMP-KDO synthetase)
MPHTAEGIPMHAVPKVLGVIPARLNSTRLPRKVLRLIAGRPMVQHVYERARQCALLSDLVVATDSLEVAEVCRRLEIPAEMTAADHASGTDRLYEVMVRRDADILVNIQGDEPLIDPAHIVALLEPFRNEPQTQVSTLKIAIPADEAQNPNVVKVACDIHGNALYFSRYAIPFDRDRTEPVTYFKHMGLYAYRRGALELFHGLRPSRLEMTERLEQLRFLENGLRIRVAETTIATVGVDTEADLQVVDRMLAARAA